MHENPGKSDWLADGGEVAALLRARDWSASPLGPPEQWPPSLRMATNLMLQSKFPMCLGWGPELGFLYNDAYVPILGLKHPSALGQCAQDVWADIWGDILPLVERAQAGEAVFYEDLPLVLERNGYPEEAHFTFSYSPLYDEGGSIRGVFCACTETTEKVRAQRHLAAEGERLRELFQQAPGFMAVVRGPEHGFELVNDAFRQLVGHRDLIGKPVREALPELEGQGFFTLLDRVYTTGQPFVGRDMPAKLQRRPGAPTEDRFVTFVYQPIRDAEGRVTGIFVEGSDVTEAKLAEERLRASERRLQATHDHAGVGICEVDREGRYLGLNVTFTKMTGFTMDDFAGRAYYDYIQDEEDRRADRDTFAALVRGEIDDYTRQRLYTGKHGHALWVEVKTSAIRDEQGRFLYAVRIIQDITARLRAEEAQRRAKDEAERANRAKSTFLAAASHDLRQPLQSLLLFMEVLKPHVADSGQEVLLHLGRGLDALRDLLDSVLDVSRLDAGIIQPTIQDFPINELLDHIGADYAAVAAAKGLELHVSSCPATVRSDRTLLGRMVRNLIENALRYTETGQIAVECHDDGAGGLHIEVHDTGIGIPVEELERIWDEFHQVGNPERDRNRGLGLGLAIVQRLSALLDHPVEVRSTPGRGSEFAVKVPLGHPTGAWAPAARMEAKGGGRLALLVDDDALVLLGLKVTFEAWGYAVLVAGSADQAIASLRERDRHPDVVVADYRLRDGEIGTDVLMLIRQACGTAVPGIVLTGDTGMEIRNAAAEHGLAIIHKPVTPRQLADSLHKILSAQ